MFERFTERARQVVVLAQDEARLLRHNYIGTEHLLLGLLRDEEGLAARVLDSLGITIEEVRAQVARIIGQGDEVTSGQIPFTPRAKKVLELSLREAISLGHSYIGTEHILLGLAREGEGVANHVLLDFGADSEKIRNEVIRMLAGAVPEEPEPLLEVELTSPPLAAQFIAELERLNEEKEQAIEAQNFEEAARLRHRQRSLGGAANRLQRLWEGRRDVRPTQEFPRPMSRPPFARAVVTRPPISIVSFVVSACVGAALLGAGLVIGWAIWG